MPRDAKTQEGRGGRTSTANSICYIFSRWVFEMWCGVWLPDTLNAELQSEDSVMLGGGGW